MPSVASSIVPIPVSSTTAGPSCADSYDTARQAQAQAARRRARRLARRQAQAGKHPCAASAPAPGSPTQKQGHAAECRARRYLSQQGLRILAANLRCRAGEIDLVARAGPILVFIEVRQRQDRRFGGAVASVNRRKQGRLIRAAGHFMPLLVTRFFNGRAPACRFDVVGFDGEHCIWIRDAFRA